MDLHKVCNERNTKIMFYVQLIVGVFTLIGTLVFLFLLATSEINFKDLTFAIYFGTFATFAAIAFLVLTRNPDNEETNPGKERGRR